MVERTMGSQLVLSEADFIAFAAALKTEHGGHAKEFAMMRAAALRASGDPCAYDAMQRIADLLKSDKAQHAA
jgi:hypothetical protein